MHKTSSFAIGVLAFLSLASMIVHLISYGDVRAAAACSGMPEAALEETAQTAARTSGSTIYESRSFLRQLACAR